MNTVTKELTINAARDTVWRHIADPDLLAAWLMRNNFSGDVGKDFQFSARPSGDWDGVINCRLLEFDPPNRIVFTWDANDIGGETLVTIELSEVAGGTRLRLIHANFENASFDIGPIVKRHEEGWSDHLQVLSSQLAEQGQGGQEAAQPVDWTRFDLHVAINAKPDRILGMWSTIDGMEAFFVEMMRITGPNGAERASNERAKPGDKFVWRWQNGRSVNGEYLEPAAANEVQFTFGESRVCVTASPYRDGSLVRLLQYDIPDNDEARMHVHANCRGGWVYFLTVLKILLEHGVDGRDKTRETGASFSTYFDPHRHIKT